MEVNPVLISEYKKSKTLRRTKTIERSGQSMKKIKFPIVWILLLAAICALTAALAKNIKWVRQESPMDGSNVSQLDSAQIAGKIAKTQKLKKSEAL